MESSGQSQAEFDPATVDEVLLNSDLVEQLESLRKKIANYFIRTTEKEAGKTNTYAIDIPQEVTDSRISDDSDTDTLIVELLGLHEILQQVQKQSISFKKQQTRMLAEAKEAQRRKDLMKKIREKDEATTLRRYHHVKVVKDLKKVELKETLKRRLESQEKRAAQADDARDKIAKGFQLNLQERRKNYCRIQREKALVVRHRKQHTNTFCSPYLSMLTPKMTSKANFPRDEVANNRSLRILKSAMSKPGEKTSSESQKHITFAYDVAPEPTTPTAQISTDLLDKKVSGDNKLLEPDPMPEPVLEPVIMPGTEICPVEEPEPEPELVNED